MYYYVGKKKKFNRHNNAKCKQIVILCRYKIEIIITDEMLHFIHKINLLCFNIKKFTVKVIPFFLPTISYIHVHFLLNKF